MEDDPTAEQLDLSAEICQHLLTNSDASMDLMWPLLDRVAESKNLIDGVDIKTYLVMKRIDIALDQFRDDPPAARIASELVSKAFAAEAKDVKENGMG